jgi:hypothetical protein
MNTFVIEFVDAAGNRFALETVEAVDHFAACDAGWRLCPEGTEDFQVTEVPAL